MGKCPHCGKVPHPIKNEDGTKNWKNILRIDLNTLVIIAAILFIVWGYQTNIAKCDEVIENPCGYCEESNCCESLKYKDFQDMKEEERELNALDGEFDLESLKQSMNLS